MASDESSQLARAGGRTGHDSLHSTAIRQKESQMYEFNERSHENAPKSLAQIIMLVGLTLAGIAMFLLGALIAVTMEWF
jgi:hypothetical protein